MDRKTYTPEVMKRLSYGHTPWSRSVYEEMEKDGVPPEEILKMIDQRNQNRLREEKTKRSSEWFMIVIALLYFVPLCIIAYKYRYLEEMPWWFVILLVPCAWMIPQFFLLEGVGNKIKRLIAWYKAWWRLRNEKNS